MEPGTAAPDQNRSRLCTEKLSQAALPCCKQERAWTGGLPAQVQRLKLRQHAQQASAPVKHHRSASSGCLCTGCLHRRLAVPGILQTGAEPAACEALIALGLCRGGWGLAARCPRLWPSWCPVKLAPPPVPAPTGPSACCSPGVHCLEKVVCRPACYDSAAFRAGSVT